MNALTSLTNRQLESRISRLGRFRHRTLVSLVHCLAEVQRRRLHLAAGCDGLASYCRRVLGEDRRKAWRLALAGEAVAAFPLAGEMLTDGKISVSALVAVKKALTLANHAELLRATVGLTEDEAEHLASRFQPTPRRSDCIRVVHHVEPKSTGTLMAEPFANPVPATPTEATTSAIAALATVSARHAAAQDTEAVLIERFELRATLTPEVRAQLDAVRSALSHRIPNGNLNDLLGECFRITLGECERRRLGARSPSGAATSSVALSPGPGKGPSEHVVVVPPGPGGVGSDGGPSGCVVVGPPGPGGVGSDGGPSGCVVVRPPGPGSFGSDIEPNEAVVASPPGPGGLGFAARAVPEAQARSRYIPVEVRRAVWARDEGRCSFVGRDGHRCGSTFQLEFDHWRAFCLGGEHTEANVRVLCARHNRFEAERVLGSRLMHKYFSRAA